MSAIRQLAGQIAGLVKTAIWNWLATWIVMLGFGLVSAAATWFLLREYSPWCWGLAFAALVECLVAAGMLAGKRGVTSALVKGIEGLGIGRATVSHLLDQVEQKFAGEPPAVSGTNSDRAALHDRRWSMQEFQNKLQNAAISFARERSRGITGWVLSLLQSRLVRAAESVIGQRVKQSGVTDRPGITLRELRSDLESNADRLLTARFRFVASRSTWLVLGVLFAVLIVQGAAAGYLLGLCFDTTASGDSQVP